jgi:hypothetical protein
MGEMPELPLFLKGLKYSSKFLKKKPSKVILKFYPLIYLLFHPPHLKSKFPLFNGNDVKKIIIIIIKRCPPNY